MARSIVALGLVFALFLSACGSSTGDRAASGAGIGATAGVVLGAVTGLSVLEGVVIGAAAGGLIGGLTDEDVINLGDPIWEDHDQKPNKSAVTRVQAGLAQLGYNPGPVDGSLGPKTRSAIREYQQDNGLPVDGRASLSLAQHIEQQLS